LEGGIKEYLAKKAFGEIAKPCSINSPPSTRSWAWREQRNATGKIHKPTLRKNFAAPKVTDAANAATLSSVRA